VNHITHELLYLTLAGKQQWMKNSKPCIKIRLGPRTSNMHVIGSKWVFKPKLKPDGSLDRLKARVLEKGYHQVGGLD
jgi:hypothetical protein